MEKSMTVENNQSTQQEKTTRGNRMPSNSSFYEKAVPAILVGMAILMGVLILFAAGILLGIISF